MVDEPHSGWYTAPRIPPTKYILHEDVSAYIFVKKSTCKTKH
jgi:hypothetical protein